MKRTMMPLLLAALFIGLAPPVSAAPYIPGNDSQLLAELPQGVHHAATSPTDLARRSVDVAIPLAQFYITRARASGDLRFLGYAENALDPWMKKTPVSPRVLVLHATILQSRHDFADSLKELDQVLKRNPDDAQAWLTRATVLRVLGRYDEALDSCTHMAARSEPAVAMLCQQSLLALTGHLQSAYDTLEKLRFQVSTPELTAWRLSELGEMASHLGKDDDAERWFRQGLQVAPDDFYLRAALSDLLLQHHRANETLQLLAGYETQEPMLLRIALAHEALNDAQGEQARAYLGNAFDVEEQRGEAVHRREQARYLLDVEHQPGAALAAAQEDWKTQREPADILILLRAAQAARQSDAAKPALQFIQQEHLEDVRLDAVKAALQ
ncbi:MAG TPA: tetratricopeptide repeat protein [Steroidobacteraceae bacterium]|jgi:tetratricopeptide (TPR) repeat protein|nr:tetratricopeptide repeat protein [Steroidobacteraceae bacterium]